LLLDVHVGSILAEALCLGIRY